MIGVLCLSNFQRAIGYLVAEKLEDPNLALGVKEISIVEDVNKALIILVTGLDTRLGLLGVIVNLPNTIG